MANSHAKTFFGENGGISVLSKSKSYPSVFLRAFGKKKGGMWEKPSEGEGKTIKVSLTEIPMILRVLEGRAKSWYTKHTYQDTITNIAINRLSKDEVVFSLGNYAIKLSYGQMEVLKLLLTHLLEEKVEFSTVSEEPFQENTK